MCAIAWYQENVVYG